MEHQERPKVGRELTRKNEVLVESNHRCILPDSDDDLASILNGSGQEAFVSQRETWVDRPWVLCVGPSRWRRFACLGQGKEKEMAGK